MYSAHGCIWRMLFIVKILISVCSSTNIIGILHNDVILPCMANYTETYSYEDLVVLWSRDSGDVIHQFFYKKDQTKNQVASFRGRTQLFHNKFLKGNLSLLLKQLRDSDVGTYECLFFLKDMDSMTKKYVQLAVQEIPLETQNPRFKYSSIAAVIVGVILVSVILICIQSHSNRIRSNSRECDRVGGFNLHITGLARTQGEKYVPRTFLLLNGNYTNPDCAYTDTVKSEELFTLKKEELSTRRMLLTGEAGVGKTYFAKYLIDKSKHSGNNLIYKDILYLPFTKLNSIKKVISVNDLLNKKYKMFGHTLPHVQNNSDFLIILDGLDEFIMDLKADPLLSNIDSTSRLPINSLILKLLCKNLLPNTDVLITSRVNVKSELNAYFDRVFFLPEFTNDEIKLYFETFASNAEIAKNTTEYIQKYNLSSIVSLPILCTALCEASKFTDFANYSRELSTCSRLMVYPLQCYLRNISCPMGENHGMLGANDLQPNSKIPEKIKILVHQIAKLSYENMISGAHKFKIPDYDGGCPQTQQLLKVLCEFYFRRKSNTGVLKYRHPSVRDLFAALYKIWNVQELEEITECLKDWILGTIEEWNHLTTEHYLHFILGLLTYRDIDSLLNERSTSETFIPNYLHKKQVDSNLLSRLHYIFEHHNTRVKDVLSKHIKSIKLINTPLTTLDIAALQYCLEKKRLKGVEIDLVGFKERNLLPLENIIRNSTNVKLHFSKYTEKSFQVIRRILQHTDCAIKSLCFCMRTLSKYDIRKIQSLTEHHKQLEVFIQRADGRDYQTSTRKGVEDLSEKRRDRRSFPGPIRTNSEMTSGSSVFTRRKIRSIQ